MPSVPPGNVAGLVVVSSGAGLQFRVNGPAVTVPLRLSKVLIEKVPVVVAGHVPVICWVEELMLSQDKEEEGSRE